MTKEELERKIRAGIPISAHMDFRVVDLEDNAITIRGGGAENVNVHGTAFAGSLYALTTLSVWGLVHSRLPEDAALVMAEGRIRYHRPVTGDIIARCVIEPHELEDFLDQVNRNGKGRLMAISKVQMNAKLAAEFTGQVYARLEH